jgi:ABC-type phosphate/phosphonate transport system substrate-binding protein
MKEKQIFVFTLFAAALAALSLAACAVPLETPNEGSGKTGRVIISIAGGLSPAEAARNAAPAPDASKKTA